MDGVIHVVWRIRRGLPTLRTPRSSKRLESAFRKSKEQPGFILTQYSIQNEHLHVMVEVEDRQKLSRGLQALGIRIAKTLNSLWHRKKGQVFAERYFAIAVKGWSRIRSTVRYIVNNGRKHGTWTVKGKPDPFSSGPWFFRRWGDPLPVDPSPVVRSELFSDYDFHVAVDDVPGQRIDWSS